MEYKHDVSSSVAGCMPMNFKSY